MNTENSPTEGSQTDPQPDTTSTQLTTPLPPLPQIKWWNRNFSEVVMSIPWRKILSCVIVSNPFFLLSALFMLQGIYLVSVDPQMFGQEQSQLAFNFSSLQVYELLLVLTALFLARRQLWHDTALLFWLENLFVVVPFILISQASMMENRAVWTGSLCAAATLFTVLRFGSWKFYLRPLNLPATGLALGAVLLIANLAFPLHFREVIGEDSQAWTQLSPHLWRWFMPVLFLALLAFPRSQDITERSLTRRWTPLAAASIWIIATAVHLRSMDYLDGIRFRVWTLAPMLWALAWVINRRLADFIPHPDDYRSRILALPIVATVLAIQIDPRLFLGLTLANCALFAWQALAHRNETAKEFLLASVAALLAALPQNQGSGFIPDFSREKVILLALGAYLLVQACRFRTPRGALIGALIAGFGSQYLFARFDYAEQLSLQNALLFGLAHSLFWTGARGTFAKAVWKAFAIALPIHSLAWGRIAGLDAALTITLASLFIGGVYVLARQFQGRWASQALMVAAVCNVATVGINYLVEVLRITPTGYLVVLGAFVFFASGIAYALTRARWHRENAGREEVAPVHGPLPTIN